MNNDSFVDLTISSPPLSVEQSSSNMFVHRARSQRPLDITAGAPAPKRRRVDNSSAAGPSSHPARYQRQINSLDDDPDIESIDLTEVNDRVSLAKVLSKQREDAVKAQSTAGGVMGRSTLTAYKCPVCMDTCTDATSTICGHLFCHKCIIDTLRFGEERSMHDGNGKAPRGRCPVCRQALSRVDTYGPKRNLVPLQLNLSTRKRT
ncbi:uncharacterized protein BDCG_05121 [Blastomyces dermatitidis ER-3]|uniref:RING-type domain-containing protein n=3 Tax=Blastomyces TaxID=229219 RepID=A0A179V0P3_BLAGS|nr:uncharacterized protein BDBG_08250 [Blastomyces gilchristii SLH14081]XP_045276819.1 uncharacterized protein BDCG_05121 [Blastomyces dermatitidis ER-3]EGE85808.1 C3HC4 type zinc finger containing protein [Blastomyces dermatitidis ATCC 18188]EQL37728.1 hypothetical protein BDFG_00777 [Blastomyces dermatitidis ATCC 26199]EEQ90001.2 hypothetical protein BDCG_05121 [Blastomyces dermatitidis ER-3]OAT12977.1 hypothetical protein BDBG_08250 [Blastomyces gilchristii SLH14081]